MTSETTESTAAAATEIKSKKSEIVASEQELDLVDLNPEDKDESLQQQQQQTTDEGALKQKGEEDFDPNEYGGFPMEAWNRYLGAINDKKQSRAAALAKLNSYTVRINTSTNAMHPEFKYVTMKYSPITKKAWEGRRKELAEVEDLERELNMQNTRIAEMQEALRLRIFSRNKPRGMITNREDPTAAQLEEIQNNMKFYQEVSMNISTRLAEKRQQTDQTAFEIYFHKGKDIYDQIMNEDVDDILRACDWKQIHGAANLRLSKPLSTVAPSQGIS